jgi:hypothetical protein
VSAGLNASGPPDGASSSKKLSTFDVTNLVVGSIIGAVICIMLMLLVQPTTLVIGLALMAIGIPASTFFSPRKEHKELRARFYSREYQATMAGGRAEASSLSLSILPTICTSGRGDGEVEDRTEQI